MSIDVRCVIDTYENENNEKDDEKLFVQSHWNDDELVVLEYDGKQITVDASDLLQAVSKASGNE